VTRAGAGSPPAAAAVLAVDDDPQILSALRRCLRREPFELFTAGSADEALALLDRRAVQVVLSDREMPGGDGLALLARVAERQPGCARLLLTGRGEDLDPPRLAALGIRGVVPKPWDDAELKRALREALQAAWG